MCYTKTDMVRLGGSLATDAGLRLLRVLRWLLPLSLALIALLFELNEHVSEDATQVEPWFFLEVVLFAGIGPVAIWITLVWVERLVTAYADTSRELAEVNRDLEMRIEERTSHLAHATEQLREANEELERANENLRELDRLKSDFVSLVSHQLRAPLTNINGALEIVMLETQSLPATTQHTLSILAHESRRLSWLIQTILDVSRIEAGRLKPRLGPVAVGPLLNEACAAILEMDPARPHEIVVAEGLPPAWADETLLGEVARILIENAMRYSSPDTPVVVAAGLVDGHIEITVTDHGQGIPPDQQERIFQSFYRVSDKEGDVAGSGLGLYFAERLVRAQGGAIRVESPAWPEASTPGSRFSVEVPVVGDVPDDPEPVAPGLPARSA
jgi:signal transduction histidine kinase